MTNSKKKKPKQQKKRKKIVIKEPAPIDSRNLTERLLQAGLNAKEAADLVILKKKQERKDKIKYLMNDSKP